MTLAVLQLAAVSSTIEQAFCSSHPLFDAGSNVYRVMIGSSNHSRERNGLTGSRTQHGHSSSVTV